nr:hypothetical protein [Akkermansiaceae bacterium]
MFSAAFVVAKSAAASAWECGVRGHVMRAFPHAWCGLSVAALALFLRRVTCMGRPSRRLTGALALPGVCGVCLFFGIGVASGSALALASHERGTGGLIQAATGQPEVSVEQGADAVPEDAAAAEVLPGKGSGLHLHAVHRDTELVGADGKTLAQRVMDGDEIVPGYAAYEHETRDGSGVVTTRPILLHRRPALGTADISSATPSMQQPDAVDIQLNGEGAEKMIALTSTMAPGQDRIAIVLDGKVKSAPVVRAVPLGRSFIIEGLTDPGEPQRVADALMASRSKTA